MNKKTFVIAVAALAIAVAGYGVYASAAGRPSEPTGKQQKKAEKGEDEEGGVAMSDAKVAASGIEVARAGEATLRNALVLNGIIQPNQETLVHVTPRFPGIVREIKRRIGDTVAQNDLLAKVESNQSLTTYEMRAPISGTVIDRQISLGEYASEQKPAFTVADISNVWVDLSVYRRDLPRVKLGDALIIDVDDGSDPIETKISYVSPVGSSDTQSALVRAVVPNEGLRLRTGLFVSARLILSAKTVAVAVKTSALQTLENRNVVFVREGSKFEARDVEIGARDAENVEILFGLLEGDRYAAKNSFIVKSEMGKGGADHD